MNLNKKRLCCQHYWGKCLVRKSKEISDKRLCSSHECLSMPGIELTTHEDRELIY